MLGKIERIDSMQDSLNHIYRGEAQENNDSMSSSSQDIPKEVGVDISEDSVSYLTEKTFENANYGKLVREIELVGMLPIVLSIDCGPEVGVLKIDAYESDSILEIKNKAVIMGGIGDFTKRLTLAGKKLLNFCTLADLGISTSVDLVLIDN
jgi:hypothetical protein